MKINFNNIARGTLDIGMGTLFFGFGVLLIVNKYVIPIFEDKSIATDPLMIGFSVLLLMYGAWRYYRAYLKIRGDV